jgi:predicted phage terminase large subunit-like protein
MDYTTTYLVQTEFMAFAMKAFMALNTGRRLELYPYLKLLGDRLVRVATGETKRLVVSLPPRHGKTFLGSICLSAWILAHNPSAKILILSYGQDLADKIAYAVREIMRSDWYRQAFQTSIARNRAKVMDFMTTAGGGVRSLSIEGGVTGLGADFIIVDDPIEIKDCDNARRLKRIHELFDNEIKTRLDHPKKGGIVIIAHRTSEDDLAGHVLDQPGWHELKLPLIAPRARRYEFGNSQVWERAKGELLRPDAFSRRDIEGLRASKRPGFETLQQQNPGRDERLRIKADDFPSFGAAGQSLSELPMILSIDPGQKGGPTNSFGVIQAWAIRDDVYMLRDQWREQAGYGEFRTAAWRFIRRFRPSVVLIEATGQGPALKSDITPQNGMDVVMVTPSESKVDRLRKHRRIVRAHRIQVPQDAVWRDDFLAEVVLFPYGEFDDQVDALSQFLAWIADNPNPNKRPPLAVAQGLDSQGRPLSGLGPVRQIEGGVLRSQSDATPNGPFQQPKAWLRR